MNYAQTLEYLYNSLPVFQRIGSAAYKANLNNTLALDEHLQNPHRTFRTVHIAGTNGKGSTSQMIYSALRASGLKVGLYTSPHLRDFRERIIVDDQMISEQDVVNFVAEHREFIDQLGPSFFEVTVAMAFYHFRAMQVDVAVIEVGMGGRLDSTNIIDPLLSVITNIDFDHTQFLGSTLSAIATEKAGIIKSHKPSLLGQCNQEYDDVFKSVARNNNSELHFAEQMYRCTNKQGSVFTIEDLESGQTFDVDSAMEGDYQKHNICTALSALKILRNSLAELTPQAILDGISSAKVKGRWQTLSTSPLTICDTGHNKAGIRFIVDQLSKLEYSKLYFVLGVVNDKDLDSILPMLPKDAYYIFTQASIPRALPAQELYEKATRIYNLKGEVVSTVASAMAYAQEMALQTEKSMVFVGGSTFTVAEVV